MCKSTNVSIVVDGRTACALRRCQRVFAGAEPMLPIMLRALADAWDESGGALKEAGDALDLESRAVAPFTRMAMRALSARLERRDDELAASRERPLRMTGRSCKRLLTCAGTLEFRVRRYRDADGIPRYPLFEDTGICKPREKASRGLKAFTASMACGMAYRQAAAHVALYSREQLSPAAVKDALAVCAAPLEHEAEQASQRWLDGEIVGDKVAPTLFMEADGVYCHLQRTRAAKQAHAPRWAQVRDAKAYSGKTGTTPIPDQGGKTGGNTPATDVAGKTGRTTGSVRCEDPLVYAAVEDAAVFADRLAGLVNARWDLSQTRQAFWGGDGEHAYQDIGSMVYAGATGVIDRWHVNDKTRKLAPKPLHTPILKAIDKARPDLALRAISQYMSVAAHQAGNQPSKAFERTMARLTELYRYIGSNATRMRDVSMGTIEATNAHVVCARTKHTGLAWSVSGLDSMVRCRASLANSGKPWLTPAPATPGGTRPESHVTLEHTRAYMDKPPLTASQAIHMHEGNGTTARQAHIATNANRKHATRHANR